MSSNSNNNTVVHAEDLSRMEGEFGAKMIGRLKQMDVLVIGLKGLGIETAKNIILAGPHGVVLYDDYKTEIADLGANFYLTNNDVGKPRGQALISQLGELNPNVNVNLWQGPLTQAEVNKYDVVVVTNDNYNMEQLKEWNEWCRSRKLLNEESKQLEARPAAFLVGSINGAVGYIFSDFGAEHICFDNDGVAVKSIVVDHISKAKNGVVTIDGDRHLLNDGDLIKLEEVQGMSDQHLSHPAVAEGEEKHFGQNDVITDINSIHVIKTTKNPKKFLIGDTTQLGEYSGGGIGTQVKKVQTMKFQPLQEQLYNPTFISGYMDFTKFGRDSQLHLTRLAIWQFQQENKRLPGLHSAEDANKVTEIAKKIAKEQKDNVLAVEVEEDVVKKCSLYFQTELTAMAALFGGILAQEITKQAGKYTPITQWFHFDAFELLDDNVPNDAKPIGSRYDNQISVFGRAFQELAQKQKVFCVGSGALGCEYVKAFALMGLGCGEGGQVTLTDDDTIELSNLSRQFLFRRKHVGHNKSTTAAASAVQMNPDLAKNLKALNTRVEPKTEDVFDDDFWDSLNFVVNALDNMQARKYVDSQCVLHRKPLFESGTLGTQANSVICLPFKTPSYAEGAVAGEEGGIAQCTLRNFPSDIIHCIEWSKEKFNDLFLSGAEAANSFLENREAFLAKLKQDPLSEAEALKSVQNWLKLADNPTFETCVKVIFDEFNSHFRNAIKDLTHNFPKDARNIDRVTGADLGPFWHGHKRFPQAFEFNPQEPLHLDYIYHGANILASVFGLKEQSKEAIQSIVTKYKAPEWSYSGTVIKLDEDKKKEADKQEEESKVELKEEDVEIIKRLTDQLNKLDISKYKKFIPAEFEKDNDKNHHIDWITSATNLRAGNYFLKPATRAKVRLTAGKIIPAIATTTACITGFIGLEIYKYIKQVALEKFRSVTINLATNTFVCENLPDPKQRKSGLDPATYMQIVAIPEGFTVYDLVIIDKPDLTVKQFLDEFTAVHHGCVIEMLATTSGTVIYNTIDLDNPERKAVLEARLNKKLVDVYTELVGPVFPPKRNYLLLDVSCEDDSGNPGLVPTIKYIFKH